MKKINLLTTLGYQNYGNRLQNYALVKILQDMNFEVVTLRINPKIEPGSRFEIKKLFNPKRVFNKVKNIFNSPIITKKISRTKEFSDKYLRESNSIIKNLEEFKEKMETTDYVIVGSDQVWNPSKVHDESYFFAPSTKPHQNIAYAPSFGVEEIPIEYKEQYIKGLNNFAYLSVREESGNIIIKELTNLDVPVLVDPTLLLTKEEWIEISRKPKSKPQTKYLLTYFIRKQDRRFYKRIESFAKKENLKVINLLDLKDKQNYIIDPSEFIDLFNDANIIFTDSFHGTIFSIIFEKPFVVFNSNEKLYTRIESLLTKFNLGDREYNKLKISKDYFNIKFNDVDNVLCEEREKAKNYLKEALK